MTLGREFVRRVPEIGRHPSLDRGCSHMARTSAQSAIFAYDLTNGLLLARRDGFVESALDRRVVAKILRGGPHLGAQQLLARADRRDDVIRTANRAQPQFDRSTRGLFRPDEDEVEFV